MVINNIFTIALAHKIAKPFIIFCGGLTDCFKPYRRNEAEEMIKLFRALIQQKSHLKSFTAQWALIAEKESLSTLENLLNPQELVTVFCEYTRGLRVAKVARKVFGAGVPVKVEPIDFDMSPNRYLAQEFIAKKEKAELAHSLWALKSPEHVKRHHEVFQEKLVYFRSMGPAKQSDAIRIWWEKKLKEE